MRLCRFNDDRLGLVEDGRVFDVTGALRVLGEQRYPLPPYDLMIARFDVVKSAIADAPRDGGVALGEVSLLSPVANPGKIVAAPVNYQAHLDEAIADEATFSRAHVRKIQETGLFLKATSSLVGAGAPIRLAHPDRRTDHEVELVAVIGRACRGVSRREALGHVLGYSIGLDITIRGPEERSLRKSLDTYSVLGPMLVTADEFGDPTGRELMLSVDGKMRQRANTRDLIMDVAALIEFASAFYTLHPGDLLFTGTPEGVGPIEPGERIDAAIEGVGEMQVDVIGA